MVCGLRRSAGLLKTATPIIYPINTGAMLARRGFPIGFWVAGCDLWHAWLGAPGFYQGGQPDQGSTTPFEREQEYRELVNTARRTTSGKPQLYSPKAVRVHQSAPPLSHCSSPSWLRCAPTGRDTDDRKMSPRRHSQIGSHLT